MDLTPFRIRSQIKRTEWRFTENLNIVILYILIFIYNINCQSIVKDASIESGTKSDLNIDYLESKNCHTCIRTNQMVTSYNHTNHTDDKTNSFIYDLITTLATFTEQYIVDSKETRKGFKENLEQIIDEALSRDRYEIIDGVEIKTVEDSNDRNEDSSHKENRRDTGRALFSKFTYEYRLYQKIKNFIDTHILSINLPKAARFVGFRSFGLKKFFLPLLIGAQVFKGIMLAMFLPSILGSFGKILGKGISQISAASSQASYPPVNMDEQDAYNNDNKELMGYDSDAAGTYTYPQDYMTVADANDVNELSNVDLSRFGGQKVSYLPSKNGYYKNQMQAAASTNYKIFQKIPASSMILSNYDPFYSPLLSRLDGIFARLGLAPSENSVDSSMQIGGQNLNDIKLEACREQLICLMYSSPAKYAPYSNLVSAQLSRELNELRRPVSDNPEILRFFRYMRAARRGQEGVDCVRAYPSCLTAATPAHTMIAAYHDINKLVSARKLK